jgi:hypothetical protein
MSCASARTTHLSGEGDWRLIQALLLWVPNIGRDDLLEGQTIVWDLELHAIIFGFDCQFAANSILYFQQRRIEGVDGEGTHVVGRTKRRGKSDGPSSSGYRPCENSKNEFSIKHCV